MTLQQLLDCSAAELRAMTDEQLLEHFKPYLTVTRPELAPRPSRRDVPSSSLVSPEQLNQMKVKIARLKALGVEVDEKEMFKYLKKKV